MKNTQFFLKSTPFQYWVQWTTLFSSCFDSFLSFQTHSFLGLSLTLWMPFLSFLPNSPPPTVGILRILNVLFAHPIQEFLSFWMTSFTLMASATDIQSMTPKPISKAYISKHLLDIFPEDESDISNWSFSKLNILFFHDTWIGQLSEPENW